MLKAEASWLGNEITNLGRDAFPMLNLGSSTAEFRQHSHPWVQREIFDAIAREDRDVIHSDIERGSGVDVVADLSDHDDRKALKELNFRSILFTNMFEHLPFKPIEAAAFVEELLPANGFLIVSGPLQYGYHPAPIDNMYRPTVDDLVGLFPNLVLRRGAEVRCHRTAWYYADNGQRPLRYAARMAAPFLNYPNWADMVRRSMRRTSASCAIFQKVTL